jgi:beta-lactam-binding protein with PASTA domain
MATKKNSTSSKKNTTRKPIVNEEVKNTEEKKVVLETTEDIKELMEGRKEERTTKKSNKHPIVNITVIMLLIFSIVSFGFIVLDKSSSIMNLISSLLLTVFVICFAVVSITYKRNSKSMIFIGSLLLIGYFALAIINPNNTSTLGVPNFSGKSVTEVMKWASKNDININQEYEYSDMIDEYKVISQEVVKKDNKITDINIAVSEGANPSKEIIVPSMIGWDDERVLKFIKDNYLSNVNVEFIASEMAKDTVINQSASGNLKRDDELNLTFSYGEELDTTEVSLIDFTNKSKFEVEFYMKQHQLIYSFDEEFSSKIKRGYAVKQSIAAGDKVSVNSTSIVVTISKGPEIKVPDLKKLDMTSITEWAIKNKVKLNFSDSYDDTIKLNNIISTSVNEGDIIEQGTVIKVVLSRGNLKMPKFDSLDEFYEWANKYSIKYEEQHEFSDTVPAGKVISYSYKTGSVIKNGDSIVVNISDGSKKTVPNVVGLTKSNAISKLENAGVKYSVNYKNSTETKDKVIGQSISAGSEISSGTTVVINVSNGKTPTNNNSNNNSSNNNNGNNNVQPRVDPTPSTPDPTPTPSCKDYSIRISEISSILDDYSTCSSAANGLKSRLESKYSGLSVSVSCSSVDGYLTNDIVSGFKGGTANTCNGISITLAN